MTHYETLKDLLVDQLQDIYDCEHQLVEVLPRMVAASKSDELSTALRDHYERTHEQIARIREVFGMLNVPAQRKECKAMAGVIDKTDDVLASSGDCCVLDAAIIACAQRMEHYEMAVYGCIVAFAEQGGHSDIAKILDESMDEEGAINKLLSKLAEGSFFHKSINKAAAKA